MKIRNKHSIAVIGLSSSLDRTRLAWVRQCLSHLKACGHEVRVMKSAFSNSGYKSASRKQRVRDLHAAFQDPEVTMIINTTGGFNSNEILGYLDYELIQGHPKYFVGYSDITAVNLALYHRSSLQTVNGPMLVDYGSDPHAFSRLFTFLDSKEHTYMNAAYRWETGKNPERASPLSCIKGGSDERSGTCIVGNVSTLCLLLGTPYCPSFDGAVLFLEYDKEEAHGLPSIERMMWQLKHAGILDRINGLIFGQLEKSVLSEEDKQNNLTRILLQVTDGLDYPVFLNASFGHVYPSWILVNGAEICINEETITARIVWAE
jgi:muramoyltetrapeptide carboxypeptidase